MIISRMFMEYYKNDYQFYETHMKSKDNKSMYLYLNSKVVANQPNIYVDKLAQIIYNREYSLKIPKIVIMIFDGILVMIILFFFGQEKIALIKYFIDKCYHRDGVINEIQKKLIKVGYHF